MANKRILAVVGSTGSQGGGLAIAALQDRQREFAIRAITRDPDKEKARALALQGAEVVRADLDDVESLKRAFAGAHGVYAVTNFWEHLSAKRELSQARNIAVAARWAGIDHVIWSTLEDTRPLMSADDARMPWLQHHYRVPHIDAKAEANVFFADLPVTYLLTSYYWDNLYLFGLGPTRDADGSYVWTLPLGEARLPGLAADDIGKAALGIFKHGARYIGASVGIVSESLTVREMAAKLSRGLQIEPVRYAPAEPETYRAAGGPGADEVGNMFHVYRDFEAEFVANRSQPLTRQLNPSLQSFDEWVINAKDRIRAALGPVPTAVSPR